MKIDQLISELLDARKAIGNAEVVIYNCVTSKGFELEATNPFNSTMENPDGEVDLLFTPREIPLVDRAGEEQLDWLYKLRNKMPLYMPNDWVIPMNNALDMAIKALEQQPKE